MSSVPYDETLGLKSSAPTGQTELSPFEQNYSPRMWNYKPKSHAAGLKYFCHFPAADFVPITVNLYNFLCIHMVGISCQRHVRTLEERESQSGCDKLSQGLSVYPNKLGKNPRWKIKQTWAVIPNSPLQYFCTILIQHPMTSYSCNFQLFQLVHGFWTSMVSC